MKTPSGLDYRLVVFEDLNDGSKFIIKSSAPSEETIKWTDGQTYPLVKVHISRQSHPFYTGQEKIIDVEGRVDKFRAKQAFAKGRQAANQEKARQGKKISPTKKEASLKNLEDQKQPTEVAKPKTKDNSDL